MTETVTVVAGVLTPGRAVDTDTFTDLTDVTVSAVESDEGMVTVTFDGPLPVDVVAAALRRITMSQATEAALTALTARVTALETTHREDT